MSIFTIPSVTNLGRWRQHSRTNFGLDWNDDGEIDPDAPYDPHIWNHLPGWSKCVQGLAEYLIEIDPANKATYEKNLTAYQTELTEAHQWAEAGVGGDP